MPNISGLVKWIGAEWSGINFRTRRVRIRRRFLLMKSGLLLVTRILLAPGLIKDSTMPSHRTGDQVPDRSGTAWERSERYLHGFIITLCLVTFFPKQALKEMRLDDGVGPAFQFNFCVVSIVSFAIWLSILWLVHILCWLLMGDRCAFWSRGIALHRFTNFGRGKLSIRQYG